MSIARERVRPEQKTGRIDEAMQRYGLGRDLTKKTADAAGAIIKIGRTTLINYTVMDQYMDQKSGGKN